MGKKKGATVAGGLGQSLIRDRFRGTRSYGNQGERQLVHSSELDDGYNWARLGGVSVTEQGGLEEFLATAELAGTEFTAERLNVQIVTETQNEALPSVAQQRARLEAQRQNRRALRIPRRPEWTRDMTAELLQEKERLSFLEWRRSLSELQDNEDLLLTPFERNLDFWRQLWRVIERSDVVVQIVDARHPLLFRCPDVEEYVKEVSPEKRNLLLINKADLLTHAQREQWCDYFNKEGINFVFFSAAVEAEKFKEEQRAERDGMFDDDVDDFGAINDPELRALAGLDADDVEPRYMKLRDDDPKPASNPLAALALEDDDDDEEEEEERAGDGSVNENSAGVAGGTDGAPGGQGGDDDDEAEEDEDEGEGEDDEGAGAARPEEDAQAAEGGSSQPEMSTGDLFDVDQLLELLRDLAGETKRERGLPTIGLVGYPNVGKSSTINAICRAKLVSVSATPGKTKHFQTILLPSMELCDCPGLVFPNFANTRAELVCNGILPVDHLRDVIPPATYITQRIPRDVLDRIYGIRIIRPAEEDDQDRLPTAWEFLNAYSFARGFMNARGLPDVMRGGRIVLKDFVKGKLLYCQPPPGFPQLESKVMTDKVLTAAPEVTAAAVGGMSDMDSAAVRGPRHNPTYANEVDEQFFRQKEVKAVIKGARGVDGSNAQAPVAGKKKHYNANKREKIRRVMNK